MSTHIQLDHIAPRKSRTQKDRPGFSRPPSRRRSARAESAGRRAHLEVDYGVRSSSELDEAHRRVKRNVREIEGHLRLEPREGATVATEILLTEMTRRLLSMAAYQRTICRSGQFDEVDLAAYLKQIAIFLCRSHGRAPQTDSSPGGWVVEDSGRGLSWGATGLDLGDAVRFIAPRFQEAVGRAVCACAVMFPPGLFTWTNSPASTGRASNPVRPGDLSIRLRPEADHLRIELSVADRSLGLPQCFDEEEKAALGGQIGARLLTQTTETDPDASNPAIFEVRFLSTATSADTAAMMQMETCLARA